MPSCSGRGVETVKELEAAVRAARPGDGARGGERERVRLLPATRVDALDCGRQEAAGEDQLLKLALDSVAATPQSGTIEVSDSATRADVLARPAARHQAGRSSWASSTSRRTRSPTAGNSSIPRSRSRRRGAWLAEGADILDIGAESTRPYGGVKPVPPRTSWRASAGAPRGGRARRAGLDRHHQGEGRRLGARPGARSSTTSGACSAIPTWRASSPSTACR